MLSYYPFINLLPPVFCASTARGLRPLYFYLPRAPRPQPHPVFYLSRHISTYQATLCFLLARGWLVWSSPDEGGVCLYQKHINKRYIFDFYLSRAHPFFRCPRVVEEGLSPQHTNKPYIFPAPRHPAATHTRLRRHISKIRYVEWCEGVYQ